ncbi:MAG: VWA domain-containing protein [Acidobacteriota bacterium]
MRSKPRQNLLGLLGILGFLDAWLVVGNASLCEPLPLEQGGAGEDRYRFQVSVDMVSLSVTVFDKKRRLVTDLEQEDFKVYEDGALQELKIFTREDLPLRMVILLDTSSSMRMRMSMAQEAAVRFVRSLKPDDRVKVVEFNDRVLTLMDFSSDFDQVAQAIQETAPGGATSLYEALYISLRSLSRPRKGIERQAIVVLSDGADTRSLVTFEDVRELARKADVMIYAISLRGSKEDLRKDKYRNAKYELETLAMETGGSAHAPERIDDLAGVYERIASELKSQYNLGYVSAKNVADGTWRRLQVLCRRPDMQVKTRSGYYAPRVRPGSRSRN